MRWIAAAMTLLIVVAVGVDGATHTRSVSWSTWQVEGREVRVALRVSELDRQAWVGPAASASDEAERVTDALDLGASCRPVPGSFSSRPDETGWRRYHLRYTCASPPRRARVRLLFGVVPRHVHLASVRASGGYASDHVLNEADRELPLQAEAAPGALERLVDFGALGLSHILTGWDHLVFVAVLLISLRRRRRLALAVTGFTVGHSASLVVASLGLVRWDTAAVEAFIGASIALLAAEVVVARAPERAAPVAAVAGGALVAASVAAGLWGSGWGTAVCMAGLALAAVCTLTLSGRADDPSRWRPALVAAFGLGHGLGFASSLTALTAPGQGVALPLLGFNLGVEIGQLGAALLLWPALVWARRRPWWCEERVIATSMAAAAAVGVWLMVTRLLGGG